ncbi:MAG: bifunctional 5,10-methylenetetrahydrofolate dehydrogenase/5,10-methenyltetrahydrofolate cyclohydrolase [Bacilli bacterium]
MTIIINGNEIRNTKTKKLKQKLSELEQPLGIAVIQVGNDKASSIYINQKKKFADELGCLFYHKQFPDDSEESMIIKEIETLNHDNNIDGIIVQMPLPKRINTTNIQNAILPLKDIDGITDTNINNLVNGKEELVPCTAKAIIDILEYFNITVKDKKVTILGRSKLVGKPIAQMLLNRNADIVVCHSQTENINEKTKEADIIISAVGKKHLVTYDMVKENSVIIDVGINYENNHIYGDVDFNNVKDKCSYITPVPGGVGPMTVYELFSNALIARKLKK